MANIQAPRENTISPMLNFMLQMSSLSEQRKTRELQERTVDIDEAALESQNFYRISLGEQAKAQTDAFIKETDEKFNDINTENRRQMAVTRQFGVKEDLVALKRKAEQDKAVHEQWKKTPIERRFDIANADAIGKLARETVSGLTAQNNAANQTIKLMDLQHKIRTDALNQQMSGIATMESPSDRLAMAQAIQSGNQAGVEAAAAGEAAFRDAERAKGSDVDTALKQTTPVTQDIINPDIDSVTEYSSDAMAQLRISQDTGSQPPELRKIKVKERVGFGTAGPFGWIGPKQFQVMTEQEARSKGFGSQWDAQNVAEPTTVKDEVKKTVSKTTGTKKVTSATTSTERVTVTKDGLTFTVPANQVKEAEAQGYKVVK